MLVEGLWRRARFGKQLLARVQVPLAGLLLLLKVGHLLSCFRAKSLHRKNTLLDSCALALGVSCPLEAGLLLMSLCPCCQG